MLATVLASSDSDKHFVELDVPVWNWAVVIGLILALLLIDIVLVHREEHEISFKEAGIESAVWITIGLSFGLLIWAWHGGAAAGEYYSGYLIEKSLSIDNVFVWALIMGFFAVPKAYQFRVLFWGIFGALVLRAIFVFAGVAIIERFEWVLYIFGAFLLYTAFKLAFSKHEGEIHPEHNPVLKVVRRIVPSTTEYDGQKLFTKRDAKRLATPLFAVLILVESTDVVFAVDSIPAILAVSHDQFIVLTSNAFAILGLRSLYFLLADMRDRFVFLQQGLAVILAFVGIKMLIAEWYHVPTPVSLGVIALVLAVAIVASLKVPPSHEDHEDDDVEVGRAPG